jgi:hypothetical protein
MNIVNIILVLLILIVIILYFVNKNENLENNSTTSSTIYPSYWYNFFPNDTRSKCFDCDATSKYQHGVPCFDCEIPGGRPVNKLLNRVLTR